MKPFTFVSLFAGIGGLDLGLERAGMKCLAQVEIDKDCQHTLTTHWPEVPKFGDIKEVTAVDLPAVDFLVGGFPCQDISIGGEGKGLDGARSGLWFEYYRLICEMRPLGVIIENVANLTKRGLDTVLLNLACAGYDAEWQTISGRAFGAPHLRERVLLVAYSRSARPQRPIFERGSLRCVPRSPSTEFGNRVVSCGGWWEQNSANLRVGDGVSSRVARKACRGYGNAVIPQVAEFVGRCVVAAFSSCEINDEKAA
jgi:DNA (cytosine-5)-methyltransferase 1